MIAKIIKGTSFSGMIAYMLGKREGEARIIHVEGVRAEASAHEIAREFELQASMRPQIKKAVCHTILSFSAEDKTKLSDDLMVKMAREYLSAMGYKDTQYLLVRHLDREHPHLHICINRIGNDGKTITDSNEKYRSTKVCKEITEKYQLTMGRGKENVKRHRLRGSDQVRYAIFDAIKMAVAKSKTWDELKSALEKKGINLRFKTKGSTDQIEGVIFTKDGVSFSGSHIDRSCSYSKLTSAMNRNAQVDVTYQPVAIDLETQPNEGENIIEDLFDTNHPAVDVAELLFQRKLRRQANKPKRRRL